MSRASRTAKIVCDGEGAGILEETDSGYTFTYDRDYLSQANAQSISLTMSFRKKPTIAISFSRL